MNILHSIVFGWCLRAGATLTLSHTSLSFFITCSCGIGSRSFVLFMADKGGLLPPEFLHWRNVTSSQQQQQQRPGDVNCCSPSASNTVLLPHAGLLPRMRAAGNGTLAVVSFSLGYATAPCALLLTPVSFPNCPHPPDACLFPNFFLFSFTFLYIPRSLLRGYRMFY